MYDMNLALHILEQIHESAYVDEGAEIGQGSRIWHFCHVFSSARIGIGCTIGRQSLQADRVSVRVRGKA